MSLVFYGKHFLGELTTNNMPRKNQYGRVNSLYTQIGLIRTFETLNYDILHQLVIIQHKSKDCTNIFLTVTLQSKTTVISRKVLGPSESANLNAQQAGLPCAAASKFYSLDNILEEIQIFLLPSRHEMALF